MALKYSAPSFDGILEAALVEQLTARHGEPWALDSKDQIAGINEEFFAGLIRHEQHVIHDSDEGLFIWDELDGIYSPATPYGILDVISRRLLSLAREPGLVDLGKYRKLTKLRTIAEMLRAISDKREPFNHKKPMLALENGIIELKDEKIRFRKFSPDLLLRHKAPVAWDPKATAPKFLEEFLRPMLDDDDCNLFLRQMGLILLGQNPAHRMGILEGESAAGKTTAANLLVAIVGEDRVCQLRTEHLENQFELDAFRGRTLLLGNDVGERFLNTLGAATLKGLVSTDLYHPEAKNRRDRRPLRGPFSVLIGTNCRLTYRSQGDAEAWRRRLILYFCRAASGRRRIPNFEGLLLKREGPGIVNLMIDGLRQALSEIRRTGDLHLTDTQQDRIDKLILRSDSVEVFVGRIILEREGAKIFSDDVVEAYAKFCRARDWRPVSEQVFLEKISRIFFERFGRSKAKDLEGPDGKSRRGWRGLDLGRDDSEFVATE
jgi:phage/plasmid-associated DNA primase